MYERKKRKS